MLTAVAVAVAVAVVVVVVLVTVFSFVNGKQATLDNYSIILTLPNQSQLSGLTVG